MTSMDSGPLHAPWNKLHGLIAVSIRPMDNQPFDCTTFVLEVQTVHGNELRL